MDDSIITKLRRFLNQAGANGLILDDVDGGDLFMAIFNFEDKISPRFAAEVAGNTGEF